ncbi:MAG: hypothetical protein KDK99_04310, partial [Verrucomicrobiales bacterium]|nr:hypothetical protein [Verrucomicrobiales bacterium]
MQGSVSAVEFVFQGLNVPGQTFALALQAGGLAEPILRGVYDDLPRMFDGDALLAQVESTIGSAYLDGWVAADGEHGHCRVRAVGTRQLHITAGN